MLFEACGIHAGQEKRAQNFSEKSWRRVDLLEDLDIDGSIVLNGSYRNR